MSDELQQHISVDLNKEDVKTIETVIVDSDSVIKVWEEFSQTKKDNAAEFNALKRDIIWDKFESKVFLSFENEMLLGVFNKIKPEIVQYFKDRFGELNLNFVTEVALKEETKPLYTNRDKYEHLVKHNPMMLELVKRLGLELD